MSEDPIVSIIIPARNEEVNIEKCLESLSSQKDISYEILVVDDNSTDNTRPLAEGFHNIKVLSAGALRPGWTGKANAIWTAISHAKGEWLLFTDADTVHRPDALRKSIEEAITRGVGMLSYSPGQEVGTFWEKTLQPVIFGELNRVFSYDRINDPDSNIAAANGQYILIRRELYNRIGGHEAVAGSLLEDVHLAQKVKEVGKLHFRYAPDAVRARMYQSFSHIVEGWSKNLTILFPDTRLLALRRSSEFCFIVCPLLIGLLCLRGGSAMPTIAGFTISLLCFLRFALRLKRAGFGWTSSVTSLPGLLLFSWLLIRSYVMHNNHKGVTWKGRLYPGGF